jgi:uncharacterized protein YdaT
MPWTSDKELPAATKGFSDKQKETFRSVANSMLESGEDESDAIAAGISQAKKIGKSKDHKKLVEAFGEFLEKHFGGSEQDSPDEYEGIAKSVDVEKQIFTAVVLRPNATDAHGDIYDEDTVEKACHQYNTICRKANLQHLVQTDLAEPVESYIAPADFKLGDGEVKKGDWVLAMHIKDKDIWKMCKAGTFTGFSVGCKGKVEMLDE